MRIDLDATLRAVQRACAFDWTWQIDDVARFCEDSGWILPGGERPEKRIHTNLEINHPEAWASSLNGMLMEVNFTVTDVLYGDVPYSEKFARSSANHIKLTHALSEILGDPTDYMLDGNKPTTKRWDFPDVVIMLLCVPGSLGVYFVNPGHQKRIEEEAYLMAKHGIS